ncbi:heme biosynthesis protein HemY [Neiella marina]|uniref:Heme biosynthesis protein HemY n=1 Tax=Neiella marina TaxID=508461 RepID=A0A8J2XMI4_9GAMM|nr:heme biosynthesis HemY N-terminal domain-containing protein [Neiella marina]GGA64290.1 heme biosynthesis protein HemY [Neiella marina]
MIRVIVLLVAAAAAMVFGPVASGNKGYVLIALGETTVEMTVVSFVITLIGLFVVIFVTEWLIKKILRVTNQSVLWLSNRKQRLALKQTADGLVAVAAQDWKSAERLLSKSADHSHSPELNYLVAAEAAKRLGHDKRSQKYFAQVGDAGRHSLAIAMTKARLADNPQSQREALGLLEQWHRHNPKNASLLTQLSELYQVLEMWPEWLQILPELKKYSQLSADYLAQTEVNAYGHYFELLASQKGVEPTMSYWQSLASKTQQNGDILASFSRAMRRHGGGPKAAELVYLALLKAPTQTLLDEWLQLPVSDPEQKLQEVKKRAKGDEALRASLVGITALHARYFDEASDHLKKALRQLSNRRDYLALAASMEQNGNYSSALEAYRKAVALS